MRRLLRYRDLEYVVAVAEHRSFARAATALNVSQPTLSNQIRKIETALERRLFEREGRRVELTAEGDRLLPLIQQILDGFHTLDRAVFGAPELAGRRLRVGAIPTIAPYLGPPLIARLREEIPDGAIAFTEGLTDELEPKVAAGELDVAVTATPPKDPALRARRIAREPLVYVSAAPLAADPLADQSAPRPIILMQAGHCFREFVYASIARINERLLEELNYEIAPASLSTLCSLVRSGVGDALLPEPFMRAAPQLLDGLSVRRLDPDRFQRSVQLIYRASRQGHADMARLARVSEAALAAYHQAVSPDAA